MQIRPGWHLQVICKCPYSCSPSSCLFWNHIYACLCVIDCVLGIYFEIHQETMIYCCWSVCVPHVNYYSHVKFWLCLSWSSQQRLLKKQWWRYLEFFLHSKDICWCQKHEAASICTTVPNKIHVHYSSSGLYWCTVFLLDPI